MPGRQNRIMSITCAHSRARRQTDARRHSRIHDETPDKQLNRPELKCSSCAKATASSSVPPRIRLCIAPSSSVPPRNPPNSPLKDITSASSRAQSYSNSHFVIVEHSAHGCNNAAGRAVCSHNTGGCTAPSAKTTTLQRRYLTR